MLSIFLSLPLILSFDVSSAQAVHQSIQSQSLADSITDSKVIHPEIIPISSRTCSSAEGNTGGCLSKTAEVIRLAKQTAVLLSSPPRIHASGEERVSLWPAQPGTFTVEDEACQSTAPDSVPCGFPLALTTLVEPSQDGGYTITFQSTWAQADRFQRHAWNFHVGQDDQVTFVGENGDRLPSLNR